MKYSLSSESGSALFYILIGIVLFAALSFTVSQINRGGGDINRELYQLQGSEILQFGRALQTAVRTMKIDGINDTQFNFDNPIITGYDHGGCTTTACEVFSRDGGGVSYIIPHEDWFDSAQSGGSHYGEWLFSGRNEIVGVNTDGGGGGASVELLLILPWLRKDLCVQLNEMLDVTNPGGDPPQDSGNVDLTNKFTGSYTASQTIGGGDPEIERQRAGCFEGGGTPAAGTYHFFQVLLAR